MAEHDPAYAVIRVDEFLGADTPPEELITVKTVVASQSVAEAEVARINAQAPSGARYFWQSTRLARS